ncbi:MAG: hypothetical protein GX555_12470 [Actinomycetales bacterium]|nr:hypothetical protein [Actinomycetales bacterium]
MSGVQVRLVADTLEEVHAAADALARVLQVRHRSAPRPRRDGGVVLYLHTQGPREQTADQDARAVISQRTRAALAARRAAGGRLGGPRRCPDAVLAEVARRRAAGDRLTDIARALNAAGHRTPGGGDRWWPSHVSRLLATQDGQHALREAAAALEGPRCRS